MKLWITSGALINPVDKQGELSTLLSTKIGAFSTKNELDLQAKRVKKIDLKCRMKTLRKYQQRE